MNIVKRLFKSIEQKSKLDLITELLIVENSTPEALELFDKVTANFMFEMRKRGKQVDYESKLINLLTNNEKIKKKYDPNFDKPLSKLEVNYEIITPEK